MVTALGKAEKLALGKPFFQLCRVPLGKEFFLKKIKLCRVSARGRSAKNFF